MPGMDGAQFIHELACRGLNPILAIVTGCSRRMSNSIGLMAKERGFAVMASFIKPVSTEQIGSLAAGLLRKQTAPAPARAPAGADQSRPLLDRRMIENALRDAVSRPGFSRRNHSFPATSSAPRRWSAGSTKNWA